jgi:hypothetical protein
MSYDCLVMSCISYVMLLLCFLFFSFIILSLVMLCYLFFSLLLSSSPFFFSSLSFSYSPVSLPFPSLLFPPSLTPALYLIPHRHYHLTDYRSDYHPAPHRYHFRPFTHHLYTCPIPTLTANPNNTAPNVTISPHLLIALQNKHLVVLTLLMRMTILTTYSSFCSASMTVYVVCFASCIRRISSSAALIGSPSIFSTLIVGFPN